MKFVLLLLSFVPVFLIGQNHSYSGRIENAKSQSEFLLITLHNVSDTTKVYSTHSDEKDTFVFNHISNGDYKVCISSLYYEKNCKPVTIPFKEQDVLYLVESVFALDELSISVKKKKPLIKMESGVLQVNIEDNPVFSSGTVFEMLSKMPGVSYNETSNSFRLNGKSGIIVQSDDRTLYLSGNELIQYLKSLSASDIEEVDINSAPSAKYEASGNSGIINIKTKKIKRKGIYISAAVNPAQGRFFNQSNALRTQYNTKKDRYLFYYNSSFNKDFEEAEINRIFLNQSNSFQDTYARVNGNSNNFKGEYEHQFEKSKIVLSSGLSLYKETIPQDTQLDFFSSLVQSTPDSTNFSKNNSNNSLLNYSLGAEYYLTKEKSKLTFKSNYLQYNINKWSLLESSTRSFLNQPNSIETFSYPDLENESPNKVNIFLSELDYNYKLDSVSKIELGSKAVFQKLKTENIFFTIADGNRVFDAFKSNDYQYSEWIIGAYTQYYRKLNRKFDITLGARVEINPSKGKSNNGLRLKRKLTNFFPYLNIDFSYNKNNIFSLSYNKRINRPAYKNLFPYTYFVDPFTTITGNPNLNASISNQIQLQYILKQNYVFSIGYTLNKNQIYQVPILRDNFENSLTHINIDNASSLTFSANLNFKLYKWWSLNMNNVLFYDKVNTQNASINIASENWSTQFMITNQITLPKKINLSFTSTYISPFIQGAYKTNELFYLDASISKSFLKNSLSVSITAIDILNTYRITSNLLNTTNESVRIHKKLDSRQIRLNLIYKFKRGLKKPSTKENSTINKLKQRI